MNPNQALWEKGDFTRLAETTRESGEAAVRDFGVQKGMKVLDLACGDGTTALAEARLGADVLGVDIARNLLEAATRRAQKEGLTNIRFQHGDASHLEGLADASFDLVVTMMGAMFAPKPADVAKEMVRVTRPGGRIIMGNWIPGDPTLVAQMLKVSAGYLPPPPEGFVPPVSWGAEENVVQRFGDAGIPKDRIEFSKQSLAMKFPGPPEGFVDLFRTYYGPVMNAFEAAEKAGRGESLRAELTALFQRLNTSTSGGQTLVSANYLRVVVHR